MFTRSRLALSASAAAVAASLSLLAFAQEKGPAAPQVSSCIVALMDEARVPAQEAGVLTSIEARDGMQVEAGALLAQIDDDQMVMKKKVAEAELEVAKVQAEDDINVTFADASSKAAEQSYRMNEAAISKVDQAKSKEEMLRLKLEWTKAWLGIDKAKLDQKVAVHTAAARKVQVDAAQNDIERRKIKAPFAGEVVEVIPRRGEWVNPGAPVVHLVKLDRLWVEGYLKVADFSPEEIKGRPVTVKVKLERGRVEEFKGKIVNASPLVEGNGEYRVKAEVVNRRAGGDGPWLLRPGLEPEMAIDMSAPATARERPVTRSAAKPER